MYNPLPFVCGVQRYDPKPSLQTFECFIFKYNRKALEQRTIIFKQPLTECLRAANRLPVGQNSRSLDGIPLPFGGLIRPCLALSLSIACRRLLPTASPTNQTSKRRRTSLQAIQRKRRRTRSLLPSPWRMTKAYSETNKNCLFVNANNNKERI
jgi:hypothetical protein